MIVHHFRTEFEVLISQEDDVCITGIPHERLGEAPKAYIITRWGAEVDEENVKEFIAGRCSDIKHLAEVIS